MICMCMVLLNYAQSKEVTGIVTDQATGETIPGVNVVVKGTTNGTVTNIDGKYSINVSKTNATLLFSFVGYAPQEFVYNGQGKLDVVLVTDALTVDEVIVVGYGSQKKSDVTGAVSSVKGSFINETKEANVMAALAGKVAGVDVSLKSGQPGSSPEILIRGRSSLSYSNAPLVVVDGIPTSGGLEDINSEDIKSMEILKDASSAAIYGARGANGVIIITTKRGKKGKPTFTYDAYFGISSPTNKAKVQSADEYVGHLLEKERKNREESDSDRANWLTPGSVSLNDIDVQDVLTEQQYDAYTSGVDTDFQDEIFRNQSFQQNHRFGVTGGGDVTRYAVSMNYLKQEGTMKTTDYERYTLRTNFDIDVTDRLKISLSQQVGYSESNLLDDTGIVYSMYTGSPLARAYNEDGTPTLDPLKDGNFRNPINDIYGNQHENLRKTFRYFGNISATYKFTDDLKYILNVGPEFKSSQTGQFNNANTTKRANFGTSLARKENEFETSYTVENILQFNKTFNEIHKLDATLLFSVQESNYEETVAEGQGIPSDSQKYNRLQDSKTENRVIESTNTRTRWESYMARFNYTLNDKYLFTFTGRYDGSSKLSEGNKYEFFPSGSVAWKIGNEDFLANVEALDNLKLRLGYGTVGRNPIDPYSTYGELKAVEGSFDNQEAVSYRPDELPNSELSWEVTTTYNLAVDFALWQNRLNGSIDVYKGKTTDLLLDRLIPITSGYKQVLENVGETENRGIEITLGGDVIRSKDWRWSLDLNFSHNKNEIKKLSGGGDDVGNKWFVGRPLQVAYDWKYDGVWRLNQLAEAEKYLARPGDARYVDQNGDETLNDDDDRVILGQLDPKWIGGLTSRLSYKNLDFTVVASTRQGHVVKHDLRIQPGNTRRVGLSGDYWTPENDGAEFPRYTRNTDAYKTVDASSVRIRNITLGYNFTNEMAHKIGVQKIRMYANVQNPWLFSSFDFDGFDPDTAGAADSKIPTLRTVIVGLNVTF